MITQVVFPNPGPTYSLPMGMGIMRVGISEVIKHHIYSLATIIGVLASFTVNLLTVAIGHPVQLTALLDTVWTCIVYARIMLALVISSWDLLCIV